MKLKKHSFASFLLMLPCIFILFRCWEPLFLEPFEKKDYVTCLMYAFSLFGMYYFFVILLFWHCIICEIARIRAKKLIQKNGFSYQYSYNEVGNQYCLWIDEIGGKLTIWNRYEPFSLHEVSAKKITQLERTEKGDNTFLKWLSIQLNIDDNPIELILFNSVNRLVLRTSQTATIALEKAEDICNSLYKAKGELTKENDIYNSLYNPNETIIKENSSRASIKKLSYNSDNKKKNRVKNIIFSILFIILLIPTIVLNRQIRNQPNEILGTNVQVKVKKITHGTGLRSVKSNITVIYRGEEYKLHGVPSSKLFVMKNSLTYGTPITVWLYEDELYYEQNAIRLPIDNVYFTFLGATYICFVLLVSQLLITVKQPKTEIRND